MNENSTTQKIDFSFTSFSPVTQIVIDGILSVAFLVYCLFSVILLIGISEVCDAMNGNLLLIK